MSDDLSGDMLAPSWPNLVSIFAIYRLLNFDILKSISQFHVSEKLVYDRTAMILQLLGNEMIQFNTRVKKSENN